MLFVRLRRLCPLRYHKPDGELARVRPGTLHVWRVQTVYRSSETHIILLARRATIFPKLGSESALVRLRP